MFKPFFFRIDIPISCYFSPFFSLFLIHSISASASNTRRIQEAKFLNSIKMAKRDGYTSSEHFNFIDKLAKVLHRLSLCL